jgi:glycosyltransferase involved in cell wall biosynthesis
VIATYNYGRYLGDAVESVRSQTFRDLEVIVVDDGSTDDTPKVMNRYRDDSRVRYHRAENRGPAAARNTGIRMARGTMIAFLDADDQWLPSKLDRQVRLLEADAGVAVVYARRLLVDEAGRGLAYQQPDLHRGDVLQQLFLSNFICLSSAVVRRDALVRAGLFDERIKLASAEDYDLWLRLAQEFRFDYVDEPLVLYRTGRSPAARRVEARLAAALEVMRRFLTERGGRHLLDAGLVRLSWAETCAHLGLAARERSRLAALHWYCKALGTSPGLLVAWKGLASLFLPEVGRRCLRRTLGRPADWATP